MLIIIALVIGGIVIGKSLVRNAQLREVLGEYHRYLVAVSEFQNKYNYLPGDFISAAAIWGTAASCPLGIGSQLPEKPTCDGNGDGTIGTTNGAAQMTNNGEWYRAWQHLANAGFIEGIFSGAQGTAGTNHGMVGVNIPASKLTSAGWSIGYLLASSNTSDAEIWPDNYGHILILGSQQTSNSIANGAVLSAGEAFSLDNKIDDGKPSRGTMRVRLSNPADGCINAGSPSTQDNNRYTETGSETPVCRPFFIMGL